MASGAAGGAPSPETPGGAGPGEEELREALGLLLYYADNGWDTRSGFGEAIAEARAALASSSGGIDQGEGLTPEEARLLISAVRSVPPSPDEKRVLAKLRSIASGPGQGGGDGDDASLSGGCAPGAERGWEPLSVREARRTIREWELRDHLDDLKERHAYEHRRDHEGSGGAE